MELVYVLIFLLLIICVAGYLLSRNSESFKGVSHPTDATGVPSGEPRTRKLLVDMGDHNTIVTITHGTTEEYVILIHGYPLSQETWVPAREEFALQARNGAQVPTIITYDLRGCGSAVVVPISDRYLDANPSNVDWTLSLFSDDLYRIYKEIIGMRTDSGVRKISIGGWGFGGAVAQEFALQYPNLLKNLYLFSTLGVAVSQLTPTVQMLSQSALQHKRPAMATLPTSYINKLICEWFSVEDTSVCPGTEDIYNDIGTLQYELARALLTSASLYAELQVVKIVTTMDLLTRWTNAKQVPFNVTFVAPTQDTYTPPNQIIKLYTAIKQKSDTMPTLMSPQGKHYYCLENPQIVLSAICPMCKTMTPEDNALDQ